MSQMSDSQEGATTAEEESQDTPGASQLDTQDEMMEEETEGVQEDDEITPGKKAKKAKKPKAKLPIFTERDTIERLPLPPSSTRSENSSFTVLSWNVNGIRATVKNGLEVLRCMVETERPDLVCLQVRIVDLQLPVLRTPVYRRSHAVQYLTRWYFLFSTFNACLHDPDN